jgi:hypothetical protein
MAGMDDFFQHANSRRMHNLLALIERSDPPPTMQELIEALMAEDAPTEAETQQD